MCLQRFIENTKPKATNELEEWKLVTEDSIAKTWAKSFGIDCVNVNEAELLIFQNYDVNLFRLYNPYANDRDNFDPSTNILQNTIDTTLYSYSTAHQEPPKVEFKKEEEKKDVEEMMVEVFHYQLKLLSIVPRMILEVELSKGKVWSDKLCSKRTRTIMATRLIDMNL